MASRLLIFHTRSYSSLLGDFFVALSEKGYVYYFLADSVELRNKCQEQKWIIKFWPEIILKNFLGHMVFIILLPLLLPGCLLFLIHKKIKFRPDAVLLFSWPEKLIITPLASALWLKVVWLECPPIAYFSLPKWAKLFYRFLSRHARVITFSSFDNEKLLSAAACTPAPFVIPPGLRIGNFRRQENIFTNLAQAEASRRNRKYFTIGTVVCSDNKQNIEILFQAVKKCLLVIPSLQVIIIGDGVAKKDMEWLAKNLEISAVVWLVGSAANMEKWLENFELFIITAAGLSLEDMRVALRAGALGLPIIGPAEIGLDGLVRPGQNGLLVEAGTSEPLAQAVIELYQSPRLRVRFGENSKAIVEKHFSLGQMVKNFISVIDNKR